jgi:GAF domain-containing protein
MIDLAHRAAVARFRDTLEADGVRAALRFLNARSIHRFTALFRFEGATLRNLHMIDRDDPTVERSPDLPVLESYCVFVRQTAQPFLTSASLSDPRVEGHPKQRSVQSYCGIPLMNEDGTLFGTLCHFDFEPIGFASEEVFLLEAVAPMIVSAVRASEWRAEARAAWATWPTRARAARAARVGN